VKRNLAIILAICLLLACAGCAKKVKHAAGDIQKIEVRPVAHGDESRVFTFDFDAGLWTEWYALEVMPFDFAGSIGENGAWQTHEMSEKRIADFLAAAEETGFLDWDETYAGGSVMDGTVWELVITFADSLTQDIYCFHAYPLTWDDMAAAFYNLTKTQILEPIGRK